MLVGDFLYSHAFQLMTQLGSNEVLSILADATNLIAQGEVMQFSDIGNLNIDEPRYMEVIRCKTALLFQAAAHSGAVPRARRFRGAVRARAPHRAGFAFSRSPQPGSARGQPLA